MNNYHFVLRFELPDRRDGPEDYLDRLFEAGCDDALVGTGLPGVIALEFTREADTALHALTSAIENVLAAIPNAKLVEIAPDLMNTTEIADFLSLHVKPITRQAMRKYAKGEVVKSTTYFPSPAVSGHSPLWHLADVLEWMLENEKLTSKEVSNLLETATTVNKLNLVLKVEQLKLTEDTEIFELAKVLNSTYRNLNPMNNGDPSTLVIGGVIQVPKAELDKLAQQFHIKRLSLFGSAARGELEPGSDIDLLVEFDKGHNPSMGGMVEIHDAFEELFQGYKVDLATPAILNNPYRRNAIEKDLEQLYAA